MSVGTFGDVNGDSIIDGSDATLLLTYYASASTGYSGTLEKFAGLSDDGSEKADAGSSLKKSTSEGIFGDINGDSVIDGSDATLLLTYYASASTGYSGTLEQFANELKKGEDTSPVTTTAKATAASTTTTAKATAASTTTTAKATATSATTTAKATATSATTTASEAETTVTTTSAGYVAETDAKYFMWVDIAKDKDYVFNDEFIKLSFKIKEDIPDKDYTIRLKPDLSDIKGVSIYPDSVIHGTIRVNSGSIAPVDVSAETGMAVYGDNIACKQGDTVDYYINFKNNSGIAGALIWFYYDSNAMELVSLKPVGEFAEIAENGDYQVGGKNDKKK
ncbi:MAG: hypothetical protein K6B38_01930 [Ruminococcus sp.]|nr:hypothetical protein [Ruminococcus sp.]